MGSTFSGEISWYINAKIELSNANELGILSDDEYKRQLKMLEEDRKEDSFY